jgi:hypothetical protein
MSSLTLEPTIATTEPGRAVWRIAGLLGLAHIVVMLGAFTLEGAAVEHGAAPSKVLHDYAAVSVGRMELASYLEASAFLILVPALVLLARLYAGRTEVGRTAATSFLGLGVAFVASSLAIGFPPLTASVYAAHHGVDASTIATINDLRNYGFVLQIALSAAFALALGIAALASRTHTLWVGWGGVALGVLGLAATPFAHNAVSMGWMIWWVGVCVCCLRGSSQKG